MDSNIEVIAVPLVKAVGEISTFQHASVMYVKVYHASSRNPSIFVNPWKDGPAVSSGRLIDRTEVVALYQFVHGAQHVPVIARNVIEVVGH
ncbi:hypothetical protein [Hallella mizrahii]|uniref:Uncharacterized protein n=1 Tax=Hallella mizrahii TaxID=2606637 RepID=A0A7K0KIW7_9BACT|nr:hypothetical protein [Hallella mizrahii]MST85883.1 hypothetical protein [Hallella mizrahii]